jgi:lysophospholipase L1-like esterase
VCQFLQIGPDPRYKHDVRRVLLVSFLTACSVAQTAPHHSEAPAPETEPAPEVAVVPDAGVAETPPVEVAVTEKPPVTETPPVDQPSVDQPPADPYAGVALDPAWPKKLYVLTDSVVLGAKPYLFRALRGTGWKLDFQGRPALMLHKALGWLKKIKGTPTVAVVAIGYNSIWYPNRKHWERCSQKFDREAERIVTALEKRGVKKIVWVLLREINAKNIPDRPSARHQLVKAGFYFPYVNERLRALKERHPDVALADWTSASVDLGYTADAIHVNKKGALVMVDVIEKAIGIQSGEVAAK